MIEAENSSGVNQNTSLPLPPRPHEQNVRFDENSIWSATTVVLILMAIAIILGNILVLVATWLEKRLHQPTKYFVACLAVADLCVGVFSVPIRLHLHLNHTLLFPIQLCRFWTWIDICAEVASIVTLTVISVDRFYKISQPFKYRTQMSTSLSVFVISLIWLISIVYAVIGIFPHGDSLGVIAVAGRGCLNDNKIYMTITAAIFFFLPLLVIVTMYALVFHVVHIQQQVNKKGMLGRRMSSTQKRISSVNKLDFYQELKTVRMLLLVVGAFIICWAPLFVIFLISSYKPEYMPTDRYAYQMIGTIFIVILPSFNSLCNPVIYACFDREYSSAFKQLLQRVWSCEISIARRSSMSTTQTSNLSTRRAAIEARNGLTTTEKLLLFPCEMTTRTA